MKPFFTREDTVWKRPNGCLHFYACPNPGEPIRETFTAMSEGLRAVPELGEQPAEHLHMTLQMLDAFTEDLADERWQAVMSDLTAVIARQPAFHATFAAPSVRPYAVEAVGDPNPRWGDLVAALRGCLSEHGLSHTLTTPPYGPHYTVAYCRGLVPDDMVRLVLEPVARPTQFLVDSVALVAVDQHRDEATYTFEVIRSWKLRPIDSSTPSSHEN
ncbi:MAG: 2'-5' RNA ligase family protein [Propionibacteriaceae bacterium]|jgi:2'-5' RNA ligase|nr:2'-5' RNA ligase family protein [Propionibacteriaceae bacterium]